MQRLFGQFVGGRGAVGLLILRLVAGSALMLHGWPKNQHAMSWMGPGAPVPGFLQFLAAFSEIFGGLAFLTGLLTPIAALGVAATMLFALLAVHFKNHDPFVSLHGTSFESALIYLSIAMVMLFTGPGAISLDGLFFRERRQNAISLETRRVD